MGTSTPLQNIIRQIVDIHENQLWMGDNFSKKLNQITEEQFFERPLPALHTVAEILAHLTVWRGYAIRQIQKEDHQHAVTSEYDWQSLESLKNRGMVRIRKEYQQSLDKLIEVLKRQEEGFLETKYYDPGYKGTYPYSFLVEGMLHHDLYHLGQLGIIIKLMPQP